MADNIKKFVPSVADAIIRDTKTKQIVAVANTLLDSSLKQSIKEKDIEGGKGHRIQFTFGYGKSLEIELNDCAFKEEYLAMSNGVNIVNEMKELFSYNEKHVVKDKKITLTETPIENTTVYVAIESTEEALTIVPTLKEVTLNYPDDTVVYATYRRKALVDNIQIDGSHYPTAYELTLLTEIVDADGRAVKEVQIEVPRWKPDGKFNLDMKSDNVVAPKISGKALDKGVYADVKIIPVASQAVKIQTLAVTEPIIELSTGQSNTPQVLGIRGGMYSNILLTSDKIKLTSKDPLFAKIANGKIEYVGKGETQVTVELVEDTTKKDIIKVTCL